MTYNQYLTYAKNNGFQAMNEGAFNALMKAGFVFTERGLTKRVLKCS